MKISDGKLIILIIYFFSIQFSILFEIYYLKSYFAFKKRIKFEIFYLLNLNALKLIYLYFLSYIKN